MTHGPHHLDLTTLRTIHHDHLERVIVGTLLSNQPLSAIIGSPLTLKPALRADRALGGGVPPELLIEGRINNAENEREVT